METKLLLTVSIILNLVFTIHILYCNPTTQNPSWTNRAAVEAETAAIVFCSGHGRAYVDGLGNIDGRKPPCECNSCYTGADCSVLLPDCPVDANSGDPLFLEPFWMRQAESSAVLVSGWHRMSYVYQDGEERNKPSCDRPNNNLVAVDISDSKPRPTLEVSSSSVADRVKKRVSSPSVTESTAPTENGYSVDTSNRFQILDCS